MFFKPPKLSRTTSSSDILPEPQASQPLVNSIPQPEKSIPTIQTPLTTPVTSPTPKQEIMPPSQAKALTPAQTRETPSIQSVEEKTIQSVAPTSLHEPEIETQPTQPPSVTIKQIQPTENTNIDHARYARPQSEAENTPATQPSSEQKEEQISVKQSNILPEDNGRIVRAPSVSSIPFADLWFTPEKIAYIRDESTKFALIRFEADDLQDFLKALEQGYTGSSSYALKFAGESYRIERIITITGVQYNCRKMPTKTPDIFSLGLPEPIVNHLIGLSQEAGLILFGGPTGMGKTTTASALMRKYLERDGGFMYTIEDPPEMPLDGLYRAANGALGLCKQCPVENERWSDGIKSALRSRPRYILVGEIRTPETASQVLRAATSGHLVLSTIHASSVEDALNSMLKYAAGAGLAESLVSDLLARGILAVIHQKLEGTEKLRPVLHTAFANPNPLVADQMRMSIRDGKINLGTLMEAQTSKLFQGKPLFREF